MNIIPESGGLISIRKNEQDNEDFISVNYYEEDVFDRTRRYLGEENLEKLRQSKILLVGAGAVGNEVAKNMGLLGIGQINLVDFDVVTKSNLNRCVFFRPEDHMRTPKVVAIAKRLKEISSTKVIYFVGRIEEAPNNFWDVDAIVIGVDNNYARWFINSRNLMLDEPKPLINGAMGLDFVQVDVLYPPYTACLVCNWSKEYYQHIMKRKVHEKCDTFFLETLPKFPTISFATSLVGAIMSIELTKVLIGLDYFKETGKWPERLSPLIGKSIRYDFLHHTVSVFKNLKNPQCLEPFCRTSKKRID